MMRVLTLLLLMLVLVAGCAPAPSKSTFSLDHVYNEDASVALHGRHLSGGAHERIYLRIQFRALPDGSKPEEVAARYLAGYTLTAGYDGNGLMGQDSLQLSRLLSLGGKAYSLVFNIPRPTQSAVMLIKIVDRITRTPYVFDLPLPGGQQADDDYMVFNRSGMRPLYGPFAHPGDTVSLRSLTLIDKPLYLRQYVQEFPPALPPMAVTATVLGGADQPKAAARYQLTPNTLLVLSSPGTYLIQKDTVADPGQAVVVAPNKYPDLSRASELVAPLTYMTTRAERSVLSRSRNVKQELDKFWLNIGGNDKNNTRRIIKAYYENVEYANAWFTDYREGWKSDRGMVYIIFGKPSQVTRAADTEEWHYDERGVTPELRFIFERKEAPLGPFTWQLRRSPDYDKYWYAVVDQWRKGIIRR